MTTLYRVLREVYVKPGELVTLDGISVRNRRALIERGIVEPVEPDEFEEPAQLEEVEDGD